MKYNVLSVQNLIKDGDYDYFNVAVSSDMGIELGEPVKMSTKLVHKSIEMSTGLNPNDLEASEILILLSKATLIGTISHKEKGDEVVSDEFTGQVKIGNEYKVPKPNTKYKVAYTGNFIEHRQAFSMSFGMEIIFLIQDRVLQRSIVQRQLQEQ